jgi:ABC-type multidrug transport system fused ATPase/permease subunit
MEKRITKKTIGKIILSVLLIVIVLGVSRYSSSVQYTSSESKGRIQKQLTEKLAKVTAVWATVKVVSGVISVVKTIQVGGSAQLIVGASASVQPLGWANVIDNILDKISNLLLWAMGAIAIEKLLLTISWWFSLKIVVPICALFVVIALWSKKYQEQLKKIVTGIIVMGIGICSAIPLSLELSNLVETSILSNQINNTINELEGQSGEIEKEGDVDASRLSRLGSGVANFFSGLKQKFDTFIESTINFVMCFMVTNIIIPIATIFGLKYIIGAVLRLIGFSVSGNFASPSGKAAALA